MTDELKGLDRVTTGIPGLDPLLEGGLLKGGVYIIQGTPGAGKTILGNQICFQHAAAGGHVVYVTLLAESHTRMLAHLRRMSFFDANAIPERICYLSGYKILESDGLDGLLKALRSSITSQKATLLVLDGLLSAEERAPTDTAFKKFIHELQTVTGMTGCTALLLSSTHRARGVHPEHTMVDGILELTDELMKLRSLRHIQVLKMRGADQVRGKHSVQISDEGIQVVPRFETRLREPARESSITPGGQRLAFGVRGLDEMVGGGLPSNSISMILGPSGAGKTILGMQFLAEGARRGEPGLYFGFFERPPAVLLKSKRLGMDLADGVDRGLLELIWERPIEGVIDVLGERLLAAVRRRKVKRLCIDGMQGFQLAMDFPERTRDVFSALADDLEAEGVTTVYTSEATELLGSHVSVPALGTSALTHNILLLRHVDDVTCLRRTIAVLKMRDSGHESVVREFEMTDAGLSLLGLSAPSKKPKSQGGRPGKRRAKKR